MNIGELGFYLALVVQTVAVIVYVSRLGTRVSSNEQNIRDLWTGHNNHENEIRSLGRIEGKVDVLVMLLERRNPKEN